MPSASRPDKNKPPAGAVKPARKPAPPAKGDARSKAGPPAKAPKAAGKSLKPAAKTAKPAKASAPPLVGPGRRALPAEIMEAEEYVEPLGQRLSRWWHRGFRTSSFNAIYGLFLLGPAWVLTQTFFGQFSEASIKESFWTTEEFWFFSLGVSLWVVWFFGSFWLWGEPRPLRIYVFGHELTHAIWVWLWGGRVYEKKWWSRDGGYIVTDTHNFWIALAPYFYPLYSLVIILLYGAGSLFYDLTNSDVTFLMMTPLRWLFLLLGVTWAFHLSFTIWMIPKGQTDLTSHGTFFSLVIIYLMNLVLLSVFLIVAARELTFVNFGQEFLMHAEDSSEWVVNTAQDLIARYWNQ